LAASNGLARNHQSPHRLVLGVNAVRMGDNDHAPAGDGAGEGDSPRACGEHIYAQRRLEVDAAMPGSVRSRRRLERA